MTVKEFVTMSLELNLFFLRIMKEHSFFLEMGFLPRDAGYARQANVFRLEFERLLADATELAHGQVSSRAIESRQFVTQYTLDAEAVTSFYTGIKFNTGITTGEANLGMGGEAAPTREIAQEVERINNRAYQLVSQLAGFKEDLLEGVRTCKLMTTLYPLLIEHILREARFYMSMLVSLSRGDTMTQPEDLLNQEVFWNQIMAEHSKFIAGLLDPTEETLIDTARM
ncbi:MAG: DUF2935 domain-containing protein, partial [Eubacteriales bacterium]